MFHFKVSEMQSIVATIQFPHLNPVLFRLGPLAIHWYGIAYLLGFVAAYLLLVRLIRDGRLHIARNDVGDLMSWLAIGVMVGGRTGWWFFYHRASGSLEPWYAPIAIWRGGMSFHGGLIGVITAMALWTTKHRVQLWNVADSLAVVTPVGLFFGRIANFINAELIGRPTELPWGIIFPGQSVPRHPSQLYEAILEGPLLLAVLWCFYRRRPGQGQTAALFLICYGALRFGVEFTRQPDSQLGFIAFGWLTMGQLLSVVLILAGVAIWMTLCLLRNQVPCSSTTIAED